jgi:NADPH:quinone reductase-like Zn-dependent oxidoreductase
VSGWMHAVRVHRFGGPEVLTYERLPIPTPGPGEVLVRVSAAGVGPWDAWVREGKSAVPQPLPLVPGSDLSGIVEEVGPGVSRLGKPRSLSDVEAAAVPVVAVTAWQMVFDHGHVGAGKTVLVHGGAGNVGAYAVQLAKAAGAKVIATARASEIPYLKDLHVDATIDSGAPRFEDAAKGVDVVLDTVGGELLDRSFDALAPGGTLVSSVSPPDPDKARGKGVRAVFFLVEVTTAALERIAERLEGGGPRAAVGEVLPLEEARRAHEMLAGALPHRRGKVVLSVAR